MLGARAQVIEDFNKNNDQSPTIMLLSLTAGGVGLNLTAASRVFLLDPVNIAFLFYFYFICTRLFWGSSRGEDPTIRHYYG